VDEPAQAVHRPVLEPPTVRGMESILLVEDDAMVRDLAESILSNCGYSVLAPGQVQEVGSMYRKYPGRIDLLLTDVVMPGISGRELARQMTALRPDMKVLYISGYTDNAIVARDCSIPESGFLQKPFTPAALAAKGSGSARSSGKGGVNNSASFGGKMKIPTKTRPF